MDYLLFVGIWGRGCFSEGHVLQNRVDKDYYNVLYLQFANVYKKTVKNSMKYKNKMYIKKYTSSNKYPLCQ